MQEEEILCPDFLHPTRMALCPEQPAVHAFAIRFPSTDEQVAMTGRHIGIRTVMRPTCVCLRHGPGSLRGVHGGPFAVVGGAGAIDRDGNRTIVEDQFARFLEVVASVRQGPFALCAIESHVNQFLHLSRVRLGEAIGGRGRIGGWRRTLTLRGRKVFGFAEFELPVDTHTCEEGMANTNTT